LSIDQIEALKEEIWRRARERAEEILRSADEEAKRILEEARRRAEEMLRSRVEPEKLLIRRRIIGRAVSEGRRMLISAKNEVVEKAFKRALEKLRVDAESKSGEYVSFLVKSLEDALSRFPNPDEELIIYARESDLDILRNHIRGLPGRSPDKIIFERADFMGGIVVADRAGTKIYYSTLEGRIESLKPLLREKAASILFREVGG